MSSGVGRPAFRLRLERSPREYPGAQESIAQRLFQSLALFGSHDGQLVSPHQGVGESAGRLALLEDAGVNTRQKAGLLSHPAGDLNPCDLSLRPGVQVEEVHRMACVTECLVHRGYVDEERAAIPRWEQVREELSIAEAAERVRPHGVFVDAFDGKPGEGQQG